MRKFIIAIDGPAGAGKSTVAKRLAMELGYTYMDTGAMYRAFAWKVKKEETDLGNEKELKKALEETRIELMEQNSHLRVLIDGVDVTVQIRTPEISQMASKVSALKMVREKMVEFQRVIGSQGGVVVEGRDIGTVVFPRAEVKIYLDASQQERARRRYQELEAQGKKVTLEETLEEMIERDRRDQERDISPLRKAEDAIVIDSTSLEVESVVQSILQAVKKKMAYNKKSNTGE